MLGSSGDINAILDLSKSSRLIDFKRHLSAHAVPKEKLAALIPNPYLLALHAICARVVHMSGAAEVYGMVSLDDAEEIKVLAEDGIIPTFSLKWGGFGGLVSVYSKLDMEEQVVLGMNTSPNMQF